MAGTGNQQVIGGQTYTMYTPAWYAALEADKQRQATSNGTATGTTLKAANDAAGLPPLDITKSSTESSSSGNGLSFTTPGAIAPPSLSGLQGAMGSASGGGAGGGSAPRPQIAPVDTSAAEAATFNRAKDQEGQTATGALTGLRSALGGRNMLGGGTESRGTAAVVNASAGRLGDVTRQQAITKAGLDNANATTNFQGSVTERGQDYQHEEAANSLAGDLATAGYQGQIAQRGQDISAQSAANAMKLEQAQLASQQRMSALDGLTAALKVTAPQTTGAY